jgi:hypothetical protein
MPAVAQVPAFCLQPTVMARLHQTRHAVLGATGARSWRWLAGLTWHDQAARLPRSRGNRQACLVSQKTLLISSILASSSSALAGSVLPLVPAAPAILVASLNS